MPYIGQPPVSGDTTKSFRLLDNLASFTLSFDATSSSVVDTTANTLTFANHRFVTAQRVTYSDGGGTAIGGLTDGTAYFIIKVDQNTIQLASSASNANNGTAISLSSGAVGSHTLNLAFDGTNTKFKATYANGTKAKISRAGQLLISINGVLQQAQESSTPTLGFGLDSDSTIVFSQAPVSTDVLFGQILADTITNFDTQDNTLDVFTGDGSTTTFNLSKKPASNNDILVTLDGVVQYPTTTSTSNAYSVTESTLTFTAAPADGVAIQVRHIGFAGATSSAVTGLYGRTGNVTLSSSDDDITVGNVTAGIITATSFGSISGTTASFSGNVSIGGTLTYEDVTNIDAVGLITARSGVKFGASGTTVQGTSTGIGVGLASPNSRLHVKGGSESTDNLLLTLQSDGVANDGSLSTGLRLINSTSDSSVHGGEIRAIRTSASAAELSLSVYNGTSITEALRIDSSGQVAISTTTPGSFQAGGRNLVVGTNDSENGITIYATSSGNLYFADGTSGSAKAEGYVQYLHSSNRLDFGTSNSTRMTIDSSGNLGLGINSPTTGNSGGRFIHIHNTATDANRPSEIVFTNGSTGTTGGSGGTITYYQDDLYTWNYEAQDLIFGTNATERMRVDSSGRLMLGTTTEGVSGGDQLTIAASAHAGMTIRAGTSSRSSIYMSDGTSGVDEYRGYIEYDHASNYMRFGTNGAQRMRIDSSGRLLVNKTSSPSAGEGSEAPVFIQGNTTLATGPAVLGLARGQSAAEMSSGASLGVITFTDDAGNDFAEIKGACDGSAGTDDHPGRLTFLTTPNASSSPQERLRITEGGFAKFTNTGSYVNATGEYHEFNSGNASTQTVIVKSQSTVFTSTTLDLNVVKAANSGYSFLRCASGNFADTEFRLRGDGNAYADGSWSGGGADYAEYFEWSDGNLAAEDRRGISVVLDGDKIREAVAGEEPIGVISGNPSVVGDADFDRWKGKYLRDDYGSYVLDEDGYRQSNPDYDSSVEYVQREDRAEWDTVGLMGKLRIRKGQITGSRWIKMRDVSNTVEEWLVR